METEIVKMKFDLITFIELNHNFSKIKSYNKLI